MTATTNPFDGGSDSRRRPLRFSSLELLGFSDDASVWSDSPVAAMTDQVAPLTRGRHEAIPAEPDPLAAWEPEEVGRRLIGGNVRWALVAVILLVIAGASAFGYWLYQRPAAEERAALDAVVTQARSLQAGLPLLGEINRALLEEPSSFDPGALVEVETQARALFNAAGALAPSGSGLRTAASQGASATLDGIRLIRGAGAYRAALVPALAAPALETDPELIQLDEAARSFGSWQHDFDEVRTALPDGMLPEVGQRLDVLSGDLAGIMGRYIDALREDDQSAARGVLIDLSTRLSQVRITLDESIEGIQERVGARISESGEALERVLDG